MKVTQKDIKHSLFLFFSSVILAFIYNFFSPHGIALVGQWEKSKGVVYPISKQGAYDLSIEINHPILVKQMVDNKQCLILDARRSDYYRNGHIPGALSFPVVEFDQNKKLIIETIKKDAAILVYCSSVECTDSHELAKRLIDLKYANVKVFAGGMRQWMEMGYPIEKK